ncbi:uncharacterized protein LOC129585481 isoform X3 [Paramacrobiotus metropolitanus]|uniref:uncharacterized protein LOC129585481 isoform X3 n=1 Tax=Paramacrobiotus metropolitanus TaxID=2943436 RepID=UPI0024457AB4|nr:uncharacterized protein LOC129585481 isoform X3 [Paramacrobiotus metropolitanus]
MKRQRIGTSAIPIVARPRPVLRPSTRLNQIHIVAPEFMSYKELVKVVGVDCEASPSSWRKAIDHSAETVVFFQVDLRGSTPRMCKSVRICQEEEKLVPSVYIGESLLSATYVKTIIGKRFLTDEDDLMKLLEHAGILQEDGEFFEENAEDGDGGHGEDEAGENEPLEPEPEPKRARVAEKPRVVLESTQSSGRRTTRSSTAAPVSQKAAEPKSSVSGGRQPVDLSPLLMMEKIDALPADDSLMAGDFDDDALPVADDDDNLPLGDDIPGSSKMEESGEETTDFLPEPEVNRAGAEVEETSGLEQGDKYPYQIKRAGKRELAPYSGVYIDPSDLKAIISRAKSKSNLAGNLAVFLLGGEDGVHRYLASAAQNDQRGLTQCHKRMVQAIQHFVSKLSDKQCPGAVPRSFGQTLGSHLSKYRARFGYKKQPRQKPEN